MQQQQIIEDPGFAPSFSYYSSNSITSRAITKVIREEEAARFNQNVDDKGEDFEFSFVLSDELETSSQSGIKDRKSSSSGSGSKRWIFRYLLRRSSSEGKEPMVLLTSKKADSVKHKRNSGEESKFGGRWKAQTPVHEQFYVRKRAENEMGKRRSYLPYRKDLVGLFVNVNGMGKMLPF